MSPFEVSVLGFEILTLAFRPSSSKIRIHLIGMLVFLFMICVYSQHFLDKVIQIYIF